MQMNYGEIHMQVKQSILAAAAALLATAIPAVAQETLYPTVMDDTALSGVVAGFAYSLAVTTSGNPQADNDAIFLIYDANSTDRFLIGGNARIHSGTDQTLIPGQTFNASPAVYFTPLDGNG